jgi:superoxide dismutase, Fe-Mn family
MENRRSFIKKGMALAVAGVAIPSFANFLYSKEAHQATPFKQNPLPYSYGALEPHIDQRTMEIHYGRHHAAYVNNFNDAVRDEKIKSQNLEEIMRNISKYSTKARNNGGGHYNHDLFWDIMRPGNSKRPTGALADAINATFGSFDNMKEKFSEAAMTRFGSGWAWLVKNGNRLEIGSTPNQDNPLMDLSDLKGKPILALDVWEHAYYLKYQNERKRYVDAWWNVVNFERAARLFA